MGKDIVHVSVPQNTLETHGAIWQNMAKPMHEAAGAQSSPSKDHSPCQRENVRVSLHQVYLWEAAEANLHDHDDDAHQ